MSLLDSASLIVTPNGYKEGKLYSVIPSDGSGDMSVVRATTATRVNSAGLVELVPYNFVLNSETTWVTNGVTITSGITDPNGGTNAYQVSGIASGNVTDYVVKGSNPMPLTSGSTITFSVYMKGSGTIGTAMERSVGGTYFFNTKVHTLTNQWQRFTHTFTPSNDSLGFSIYVTNLTGTTATSVDIAFPQVVFGTSALDYQKTETRLNIPRLDYSNGTCPSLLVEPQRTNLVTYSSSFDNAAWTKENANGGSAPIITANYGISPDGTQNADRIQLARTTTSGSFSYVWQLFSVSAGQTYTWSVWLKSLSGTPSIVLSYDGASYTNNVTLTNEWKRYEFTTTISGTTLIANFLLWQQLPSTSLTADFLAYGFQLEQGSYPTSYIPTTSASVTRNADVISKTGISSLIGQTEGTIFWDGEVNGCDNTFANLVNSEKNTNTAFSIGYVKASKNIYANVFDGSEKGLIQGGVFQIGQRIKLAYSYKSGDFALYVNGVQIGTSTNTFTFPSTLDDIFIGDAVTFFNFQEGISTNATALWKTRLTNDQLATLTTL
jgi:hypothetical protein